MLRAMRLLVVCVLLLLAAACDKPVAVEIPPPKVGVVTVLDTGVAEELMFPGRTTSPQRVDIRAQVEGTVKERFFKDGQQVKRGETLFQIDARNPEAAVAQATADVARAKATAIDAARIATTNVDLFTRGVIGREERDQSKASADAAAALVKASEAALRSAKLTRGFTTVVAPFDGRIGEAQADVGENVGVGNIRMAVLARLDPIYADFSLSEREYLRLVAQLRQHEAADAAKAPEGAPSKAGLDALNERLLVALRLADGSIHPYQGKLSLVSVEIDEKTGTYPLRAVFPNPENTLLPGLYGEVVIRRRAKQPAVLVPQQALVLKQVGVVAYVLGENNTIEQRSVQVGQRIGDLNQITKGLEKGDVIVSEGVHKCRDGLTVDPVPQDAIDLASDTLAVEPKEGPEGWFERFLAEKRVATLVKG
jgi:membrane fusion protein, multidrug efflux system